MHDLADSIDILIQTTDKRAALMLALLSYSPLGLTAVTQLRIGDKIPGPFAKHLTDMVQDYTAPNDGSSQCQGRRFAFEGIGVFGSFVFPGERSHLAPLDREGCHAYLARRLPPSVTSNDLAHLYYWRVFTLSAYNIKDAASMGCVAYSTMWRWVNKLQDT